MRIKIELTSQGIQNPAGCIFDRYEQFKGEDKFEVDDGKILKIETSPDGEEILNAGPPEGKKWVITMTIRVEERIA